MTSPPDKIVTVVTGRPDGTTLFRGVGLVDARNGGPLARFAYAQAHPAGAVIPAHRTAETIKYLRAAGWIVTGDDAPTPDPTPSKAPRIPLPLPDCAHCHQPYRRAASIRPGVDHCIRCGRTLRLNQYDPNRDLERRGASTCPSCHRVTYRSWRFCPCGTELDPPVLVTRAMVEGLADGFGKLPE